RKPMICSSLKRFFTSNLLLVGDWTPKQPATQLRGDVASTTPPKTVELTAKLYRDRKQAI
ncbi:hypothetical protein ABE488_07475, partial [Luteimonas sp. TWI662]|uniref:hypothetical protein n=1 Tax=Luteimonas sp. TWI662 TaxID=3136789 RepID=UPI003207884A